MLYQWSQQDCPPHPQIEEGLHKAGENATRRASYSFKKALREDLGYDDAVDVARDALTYLWECVICQSTAQIFPSDFNDSTNLLLHIKKLSKENHPIARFICQKLDPWLGQYNILSAEDFPSDCAFETELASRLNTILRQNVLTASNGTPHALESANLTADQIEGVLRRNRLYLALISARTLSRPILKFDPCTPISKIIQGFVKRRVRHLLDTRNYGYSPEDTVALNAPFRESETEDERGEEKHEAVVHQSARPEDTISLRDAIERCKNKLGKRSRVYIELREKGYTLVEAMNVLGVTYDAAREGSSSARRQMRKCLKENGISMHDVRYSAQSKVNRSYFEAKL